MLFLYCSDVCDGQTVHLVKSSAPKPGESTQPAGKFLYVMFVIHYINCRFFFSGTAAPAPTPSSTFGMASATPAAVPDINSLMSQFGGMGQGMGQMGGGMPGMNGADMNAMSQQMMQNPEMMQQMMNSPMMQSMLNNPEMMTNLLNSNPQIQAMLDSNPQMRHIMNDPAVK